MELYHDGHSLISYDDWHARLESIKSEVKPSTLEEVRQALKDSIGSRIPQGPFGIFLSGGIDSTLIGKLLKDLNTTPIAFTVGTKESEDIKFAKEVAALLDLPHKVIILEDEDVHRIRQACKSLFGGQKDPNPAVLFGVGVAEFALSEAASKEGITQLFTGLGAEEIFGGYQRHLNAQDLDKECWEGLNGSLFQRDLKRTAAIASHFGLVFHTPFLDRDVIRKGMGLKAEDKVKDGFRKFAVASIAKSEGLPDSLAFRKKKGAQYGSAILKSLERLAKREGRSLECSLD